MHRVYMNIVTRLNLQPSIKLGDNGIWQPEASSNLLREVNQQMEFFSECHN